MELTKLSGRVLGLKVLEDWILLSVTGLEVVACNNSHLIYHHNHDDDDDDDDNDDDDNDDAGDDDGDPLSGTCCCCRSLPVYPVPLKQKLPPRKLLGGHDYKDDDEDYDDDVGADDVDGDDDVDDDCHLLCSSGPFPLLSSLRFPSC